MLGVFLLIVLLLVIVWRVVNYYYMNFIPRGMSLYFANKGSGKTTLLARYAYLATHKKRYIKRYPNGVYSNVPIAYTKLYDVKTQFGLSAEMENCLILADEGAIWFPNTKNLPEHQKAFFRLSRHYNADIIICSQSWEDVNVVIRRLWDNVFLMNRSFAKKHVTGVKPIKKSIIMTEESREPSDQYNYIYTKWITFTFNRRPYYDLFDSYDRPILEVMKHRVCKTDVDIGIVPRLKTKFRLPRRA